MKSHGELEKKISALGTFVRGALGDVDEKIYDIQRRLHFLDWKLGQQPDGEIVKEVSALRRDCEGIRDQLNANQITKEMLDALGLHLIRGATIGSIKCRKRIRSKKRKRSK